VIGILDGWEGLIKGKFVEMDREMVSGILAEGGTIIGTSRTNPFKIENGVERVKENIKKLELDALITVGGDDTNGVITKLTKYGVKGVGIPQTIDNDINYSDFAIGSATALETVTDCLDKLHTTACSHHRVMVVEIMGRDSGWLTLNAGIAGGADIILIPEVAFSYEEIANIIEKRKQRGKDFTIIAVAEGAKPAQEKGQVTASEKLDAFGHVQLGGIGNVVAKEIEKRTGHSTRVVILGHLQRGGRPIGFDRIVATRLGAKAVELVHEGKFGQMAVMRNGQITSVSLEEAFKETKPIDEELYKLSKLLH
jgi:6-phosphofructokinase